MGRANESTNPILRKLIRRLRKESKREDADVWSDLANRLSRSNRNRAELNTGHIDRHTEEGDTVVVPGKVIGSGKLEHAVTVGAFSFSASAREKILDAGGEPLTIEELLEKNPDGENVSIME